MKTPRTPASEPKRTQPSDAQEAGAGFSQVDLLTVIMVLLLLALLLTPALARSRVSDQSIQCRNNLRQLLNAWRMYVEDNSDKVPSAWGYSGDWCPFLDMSWLGSALVDGDNQFNWDPDITIKKSPLWPYCGNSVDIWRCPGDAVYPCLVTGGPRLGQYPRVRSYSMNDWFNGSYASGHGPGFKIYFKLGDCLKPGPAMTFVFAHERVDSINDGQLVVGMIGYPDQPSSWSIVDLPTNVHDGACGFAFVDGHCEMHRWRDLALEAPWPFRYGTAAPNGQDAYWLMDHTTRKP